MSNSDNISQSLYNALEKLEGLKEIEDEIRELKNTVAQPPRVVVVGRLKAGKSTLVNALIGKNVSPTAALEATNVVTVFHDGPLARAIIHLRNGQVEEVFDRGNGIIVPRQHSREIEFIERWFQTNSLEEFSLIDTPGLSTLTEENDSATRSALLDGYDETRKASIDADAAIFLFDSKPRRDEMDFIRELGFTPFNTIGVLSRADSFGQGALGVLDPIESAKGQAASLSVELAPYVLKVIPVAGLLAEASRTGTITEEFALTLKAYSSVTDLDLIRRLHENSAISRIENAPLTRVVDTIGEYGLFRGREQAKHGATSLRDWLDHRAGLCDLQEELTNSIGPFARKHRALRVIEKIEQLAYLYSGVSEQIRLTLLDLRTSQAMSDVMLLQSLKSLSRSEPKSPLIPIIVRLGVGHTLEEKLGLPTPSGEQEILREIGRMQQWLKGLSFTGASAEARAAANAVSRIYSEFISDLSPQKLH